MPRPPWREGLRGKRLGGAGVGLGGVDVGAELRAVPTHCCCCGGPRRGARGPRGVRSLSPQRARGHGLAGRGPGAVRRGRGLNSRALSPPPSAAAEAPCEAPGSCARAAPRADGAPGAVVGAAVRLAGGVVSAPRAPGAPSPGGAAGLAARAAGKVSSVGSGPWVDGPFSAEAARGLPSQRLDRLRCLRQPPLLALLEGLPRTSRGDGGAGAAPAVVEVVPLGGALGVRHHCYPGRHASAGEPFSLPPGVSVSCRGQCCAVLRGRKGGRRSGSCGGVSPVQAGAGGHPSAVGGGRGIHAAHASRHCSQSGAGLRALGPRGSPVGARGSRTRWTPATAVTSCFRRKVCIPSRAAGAGWGGAGYRCCPVEVGGGDPQDPLLVLVGHDDEEEPGGARAFLPEDLPRVVGTPGPGEGVRQIRVGAAARAGHQVGSLGSASHMTAYGGVGLAPSYTVLVGRERVGASSGPSTNTVNSPTSRSSSGGCRMWSAVSSLDSPPGCVARAWFRYGAVSPGQRVLRACSRAGALLRRDMADPPHPSVAGCPPWTGAVPTGWTRATPSRARRGPPLG